ncbi:hypothetical protein CMI40_02535 [Candidatus Pacearchaeota archaeon]|jgi:hypothetical protein|nr:hypothetical protein [Candidatus Pacearchaeota archaeon]|tara:strand:- start:16405 stop:18396 length:1992 start_codon:yes stop_codon:yes gene_type:complete
MRNILTLLIFVILITSFVSSEVILDQIDEIYNLGDTISTSATIKANSDKEEIFNTYLICDEIEKEAVPKQFIELQTAEEKTIDVQLKLIDSIIGSQKGDCTIKAVFGDEHTTSTPFTISNLININLSIDQIEFKPEEIMIIEGVAIKENGKFVEGYVNLNITDQNVQIKETVTEGRFLIEYQFLKETAAKQYLMELNIYENNKDGDLTNEGFVNKNIVITQVSTNLEIVFENQEVEPGTDLKVKAILHDQTGEKIESYVNLIIKGKEGIILEQVEKATDEFLEFPIRYNDLPKEWTVIASSDEISNEAMFKIKEKEEINVEIINKTVIITNIGNVFYNKTATIKIGDENIKINTNLEIDEIKKYSLSAPDGEYQIEIMADGINKLTGKAILTGKTTNVREVSKGVINLVRFPVVWIFIIAILGFITFMILKKGYKKSFFGYISSKKEDGKSVPTLTKKDSLVKSRNMAVLSLSLKGEKQNANVVSLKIKNFEEIKSGKNNVDETLQKIVNMAEENKAFIYENHDNLFFIVAPIITKTFKNEKVAIEIAQKVIGILKNHNKLFKQKIEFGISLNNGEIIAKKQGEILNFMSMGTLITNAKKIASLSNGEILLSKKMKDKTISSVKTEKKEMDGTEVYTIKEMKNKEDNKKFISEFLHRLKSEKK